MRIPDCGLRCHDIVFALDGIAALGEDDFVGLDGRSTGPGDARSDRKLRTLSSLTRPLPPRVGLLGREVFGDSPSTGVLAPIDRTDCGVFSGERERSRSVIYESAASSFAFENTFARTHFALQSRCPVLQDLRFQSLISFVIFLLPLVA